MNEITWRVRYDEALGGHILITGRKVVAGIVYCSSRALPRLSPFNFPEPVLLWNMAEIEREINEEIPWP